MRIANIISLASDGSIYLFHHPKTVFESESFESYINSQKLCVV